MKMKMKTEKLVAQESIFSIIVLNRGFKRNLDTTYSLSVLPRN